MRGSNVHPVNRFSKQTSNAASAWDVKTVRCSPATSCGRPYSFPTASRICASAPTAVSIHPGQGRCLCLEAGQERRRQLERLTCMFTRMPSPLAPLTMAVTTTSVSLATKFRMHRSFLLSCDCDVACRSNFNALAQAMKRTRPQMYCSSDRGSAMVVVVDAVCVWREGASWGQLQPGFLSSRSVKVLGYCKGVAFTYGLARCQGELPHPRPIMCVGSTLIWGPLPLEPCPTSALPCPCSSSLLLQLPRSFTRLSNLRDTTRAWDRVHRNNRNSGTREAHSRCRSVSNGPMTDTCSAAVN